MIYWYVLFVKTGQEYMVERFLQQRLDSGLFMPFVPLQELVFKRAGKVNKELKPLFPSYVFVESELSCHEFQKNISQCIRTSRDIVCLLRYSDTQYAMKESERQMLLRLCNDDRCIEASSGIIEGDQIHIIDGPLKGLESIVKKINRHTRQACIEMEFMGDKRLISVMLEVLKKSIKSMPV